MSNNIVGVGDTVKAQDGCVGIVRKIVYDHIWGKQALVLITEGSDRGVTTWFYYTDLSRAETGVGS